MGRAIGHVMGHVMGQDASEGSAMGHVMGRVIGHAMGQGPSYGQAITQGVWPKTGAGHKKKALNRTPRRHKPQNTRFAAQTGRAPAPAALFRRLPKHIATCVSTQVETISETLSFAAVLVTFVCLSTT